MIYPKEKWAITKIANSAAKNIKGLDIAFQEKVMTTLECLQRDPYGGDIKKVRGKKDIYRLRLENFRCYYRVLSKQREIQVLLFDERGSIKDKVIHRLR